MAISNFIVSLATKINKHYLHNLLILPIACSLTFRSMKHPITVIATDYPANLEKAGAETVGILRGTIALNAPELDIFLCSVTASVRSLPQNPSTLETIIYDRLAAHKAFADLLVSAGIYSEANRIHDLQIVAKGHMGLWPPATSTLYDYHTGDGWLLPLRMQVQQLEAVWGMYLEWTVGMWEIQKATIEVGEARKMQLVERAFEVIRNYAEVEELGELLEELKNRAQERLKVVEKMELEKRLEQEREEKERREKIWLKAQEMAIGAKRVLRVVKSEGTGWSMRYGE